MQLVDQGTIPEVGKFYHVRCAKLIIRQTNKVIWVPIIGEAHKDAQFGIEFKHYHIDGRFDTTVHFKVSDGKTNSIIAIEGYNFYEFAGIEIKTKRCKGLTTGIVPPQRGFKFGNGHEPGKLYWDWYDSMIGKSCKGKKCPHLGHAMNEENGVLICPLHNLKGCPTAEKIIA